MLARQPPLARDADTERHVCEACGIVGVGADRDDHAQVLRAPQDSPVQIETMRVGVDFDCDPASGCFLEDTVEVDFIRAARQEEPPGWVSDDGNVWVLHRSEKTGGHLVLLHGQSVVDRRDHEVEGVEGSCVVIE